MGGQLILSLGLAYAGMLGLCLGQPRHFIQVFARPSSLPLSNGLRLAGTISLIGCLTNCIFWWGAPIGAVGCMGLMSVSGLTWAFSVNYLRSPLKSDGG
jgi:hypothetical protein